MFQIPAYSEIPSWGGYDTDVIVLQVGTASVRNCCRFQLALTDMTTGLIARFNDSNSDPSAWTAWKRVVLEN